MLCPNCQIRKAIIHPQYGIFNCTTCNDKHAKLLSPAPFIEIIPDRIKAERQERQDSIEQPHFKGELNKKYVDLWGEQAALDKGFTKKEIKNAKYVMDNVPGIRYYKERT